jgi:hypothetical protein
MPIATLMGPPIARMMGPGGGLERPGMTATSTVRPSSPRRPPAGGRRRLTYRACRLLRPDVGCSITGAEGGGPSLSTASFWRGRYDSPSITRS